MASVQTTFIVPPGASAFFIEYPDDGLTLYSPTTYSSSTATVVTSGVNLYVSATWNPTGIPLPATASWNTISLLQALNAAPGQVVYDYRRSALDEPSVTVVSGGAIIAPVTHTSESGTTQVDVGYAQEMLKTVLTLQAFAGERITASNSQAITSVPSSTSTSSTPQTLTSSTSIQSGTDAPDTISTAGSADIGVGVTLGVLTLVAVGVFLWWRRRRRTRLAPSAPPEPYADKAELSGEGKAQFELSGQAARGPELGADRGIYEMQGYNRPGEMDATDKPGEMELQHGIAGLSGHGPDKTLRLR